MWRFIRHRGLDEEIISLSDRIAVIVLAIITASAVAIALPDLPKAILYIAFQLYAFCLRGAHARSGGINFPYEFAVMLPYVLVIVVLAFSRGNSRLSPIALGKSFYREMRV